MRYSRTGALAALLTLIPTTPVSAQALTPEELNAPRPIDMRESVWIEELTWMEVRDLLAAGVRTAIVPTGAIEQNGPYVATGKHNYVVTVACEWLARELGDALCAPVVKLVPGGGFDPPTGHMRYPGTIALRPDTYEAVLEDIGTSLMIHGFEHIVYIGDSGGNQDGMAAVAERLNALWSDARAHYIPEFYDNDGLERYMIEELGIVIPYKDDFHDYYWLTAMQMLYDPNTVRIEERVRAGLAHIDGISIEDVEATQEVGRELMQWRIDRTAAAVRRARGGAQGGN